MPHRIASAKIPEALLEAVDVAARRRGLTRNAYMRRALEAATDGTLELQSDDARTRDLFRAGADTERLRQVLAPLRLKEGLEASRGEGCACVSDPFAGVNDGTADACADGLL